MPDFVPRRDGDMVMWLKNLSDQMVSEGPKVGLTASQLADLQHTCTRLSDAIANNEKMRTAYQSAVAATNALRTKTLTQLRGTINYVKAQPGYTEAMGEQLGVLSSPTPPVVPAQVKPVLSATVNRGAVRIKFKKGQLGGINLYVRRRGETEWRLLSRVNHSPHLDRTPSATPGTIEVREYHAYGVIRDQELGEPSDIVSVTF